MELIGARLLVVITLFAGAIVAVPSSRRPENRCSIECNPIPNPIFRYETGKTYIYNYNVNYISALLGTSKDEAKGELSARVLIEVHDNCEYKLKIKNVDLSVPGLDERKIKEFKDTLSSHSLTFSFNDGRIDHVCPSPEDPPFSVNFKRGLLSAMQNRMYNLETDISFRENDVTGNCMTHYKHSSSFWGGKEISKTKDMHTCRNRHGNTSSIQSNHYYSVFSKIQNLPLVHSDYKCEHSISRHSIINSVTCEETHKFRPFSNKENGATTKVVTKLTYNSVKNSISRPMKSFTRKGLTYEHADEVQPTNSIRDVENVLYEICRKSRVEMKPELPDLFNHLVSVMYKLPADSIREIYNRLEQKRICRSEVVMDMFLDALPVIGSEGTISLMSKLLKDDKISSVVKSSWFTTLAFHPRPTEEAVGALANMFDHVSGNTDVLLGASSMIHTYCRLNPDCQEKKSVIRALKSLKKLLGYKCRTNDETKINEVISALKAFGNIGRLGDASSMVKDCYTYPSLPVSIRLAAIEAYRRVPCTDSEMEEKIDVLKNTGEDVEVRIASFLSVMRCLSRKTKSKILDPIVSMLETEPVNQVGSFIWSYLTNLQETSSPLKMEIRSILKSVSIGNKFDKDYSQYSRNYEWSAFNTKLNLGGEVQSNVIFTPKSYIPRSVMANLTAHLFGHSVNMFEIGGRMHGIEQLIEKYFSSHNSKHSWSDLVYEKIPDAIYAKVKEIEDSITERSKRDTFSKNSMHQIDRKVTELNKEKTDGSFYIKIFGNELKFVTLYDLKKIWNKDISIVNIFKNLAKGHDIMYSKSMVFADNSLTIPTLSGLPIRLSVNATSTVGAKIKGKLDVRDMFLHPRSIDVEGSVEPSGALLVSAAMYIDTGVSRHGLKFKSTLQSSSVIDGKLFIKNGEIKWKVNTPRENVELFNIKSEILLLTPANERPLTPKFNDKYVVDKCVDTFDKILGMNLCAKVNMPKPFFSSHLPYYPFNGPRNIRIYLRKVDRSMKGFELTTSLKKLSPNKWMENFEFNFDFNTPGSQVDRHVTFDVIVRKPEGKASINLKYPLTTLDVNAKLVLEDNKYFKSGNLDMSLRRDDAKYSINTELSSHKKGAGKVEYRPRVSFDLSPGDPPVVLDGTLKTKFHDKQLEMININMKSSSINGKKPYSVTGMVKKTGDYYEFYNVVTNVSVVLPEITSNLDGTFNRIKGTFGSDIVFSYQPKDKEKHTVSFNGKIKDLSSESLRKYKINVGMLSSLYPKYNWQFLQDIILTKGYVENGFTLGYGEYMNADDHKINYLDIVEYKFDEKTRLNHLEFRGHLKQPANEILYKWNTVGDLTRDDDNLPSLKITDLFTYAEGKQMNGTLDFNLLSASPLKASVEATYKHLDNEIIYKETFEEKPDKKGFKGNVYVRWAPNNFVKHNYDVKIKRDSRLDWLPAIEVSGNIDGNVYEKYPIHYVFRRDVTSKERKYKGVVKVENKPRYTIKAHHHRENMLGGVFIDIPAVKAKLKLEEGPKVELNILVKNTRRHILFEMNKRQNAVSGELLWDKGKDSSKQFSLSADWRKYTPSSSDSEVYNLTSTITYRRKILFNIDGYFSDGANRIVGPHTIDVDVNIPGKKDIHVGAAHRFDIAKGDMKTKVNYKRGVDHFRSQLTANVDVQDPTEIDIDTKFFVKSSYDPIKDFEVGYSLARAHNARTSKGMDFQSMAYVKMLPDMQIVYTNNFTLEMITSNNRNGAKFEGKESVVTSFSGYEKFVGEYTGTVFPVEDYDYDIAYKFVDFSGKKYDLASRLHVSERNFNVSYVASGPNYSTFKFGCNGNGEISDFKVNTYYISDDQAYDLAVSHHDAKDETEVVLKTPYPQMRDMKVSYVGHEDGGDLSTRLNDDKYFDVNVRNNRRRNEVETRDATIKSSAFETIRFKYVATNKMTVKSREMSVFKGSKELAYLKASYQLIKKRSLMELLWRLNARKMLDLHVDRSMANRYAKTVVTASGAFKKITVTTEMTQYDQRWVSSVKACMANQPNCLEIRVNIKNEVAGKNYNRSVDLDVQTNPKHVMHVKFHYSEEGAIYKNGLSVTFDKHQRKYFGYVVNVNSDSEDFKLTLQSPSRNAIFELAHQGNRKIKVTLSSDANHHALTVMLAREKYSNDHIVYKMYVRHPILAKPFSVSHEVKRSYGATRMTTTETDIKFSADKTKNLMVKTTLSTNQGNATVGLRVYTPHSKLVNINMKAHLGFEKTRGSLGFVAKWQPRQPEKEPMELYLYLTISTLPGDVNFYYRHPGKVIDAHGSWFIEENLAKGTRGCRMKLNAINNDEKKAVKLEWGLNEPWIDVLVTDVEKPSEKYHVRLSSPNNEKHVLHIVADRYTNGRKLNEIWVEMKLNRSHVIHTKIQWSPPLMKKLVKRALAILKTPPKEMMKTLTENAALNEVSNELYDKLTIITDVVCNDIIVPFYNHTISDANTAYKEFQNDYQTVKEMFEMHWNDLEEIVKTESKRVYNVFKKTLKPWIEKWDEEMTKIETKFNEYVETFKENYPNLYEDVVDIWSDIEYEWNRIYNQTLYENGGLAACLSEWTDEWTISLNRTYNDFQSSDKLWSWYEGIQESIDGYKQRLNETYNNITDRIYNTEFVQKMIEYKKCIDDKIGEYVYKWNTYWDGVKIELKKYPEFNQLCEWFNEFKNEFYFKDIDAKIIGMFVDTSSGGNGTYVYWERLLEFVSANVLDVFFLDPPYIDIKDGVVSWDFIVPATAKGWRQKLLKKHTAVGEVDPGYSYWDTYYKIKPQTNPRKWIPPYDASAMLVGSQHYLTFDKKHYDFVGTCSYVLARDFNDKNFTVIASYGSNRRISLTVTIGKHHVTIYPDYKVTVDDKEVDLPLDISGTSITRISNTVFVRNMNRVSVECDWNHDICSVDLNGWYFAKTSGMLGRYDNEPHNDVRTPSGEPAKEIYKFANSWSVSSKCSTVRNLAIRNEPSKDSREYKKCEHIFRSSSSTFRPCFSVVKPDEYMKMCLSSSPDKFCSVAAAYKKACFMKEVRANMFTPNECITCDLRPHMAAIVRPGVSQKIKPDMRRKMADVVYIVENKACNNRIIKKLLNNPPNILNRELRTQHIYSRVSVISYGGRNEPFVHTAKGKNFYSFRDMVLAMKTLYNMERSTDYSSGDAFRAIRFASMMDFQPAAAKVFILVKCSTCESGPDLKYPTMQNMLLQQGIVLHVLTPDSIVVKSGNIGKSKKMFGISAKTVYSQKDISQKKLVGTPGLRSQVAIPKDLCIALAQEVGGTFYTELPLIRYTSLEKNFNLVMSRQIAETAIPKDCVVCDCVESFDSTGISLCRPCNIPSPMRPSTIYQTEEDLSMIYKRMNFRKDKKKKSRN